jgi:hypothetical protein
MHAYVHIRRALLYYVNMYVQLVTLRKTQNTPNLFLEDPGFRRYSICIHTTKSFNRSYTVLKLLRATNERKMAQVHTKQNCSVKSIYQPA